MYWHQRVLVVHYYSYCSSSKLAAFSEEPNGAWPLLQVGFVRNCGLPCASCIQLAVPGSGAWAIPRRFNGMQVWTDQPLQKSVHDEAVKLILVKSYVCTAKALAWSLWCAFTFRSCSAKRTDTDALVQDKNAFDDKHQIKRMSGELVVEGRDRHNVWAIVAEQNYNNAWFTTYRDVLA